MHHYISLHALYYVLLSGPDNCAWVIKWIQLYNPLPPSHPTSEITSLLQIKTLFSLGCQRSTLRGFLLRTWHCICEMKYNFYILFMTASVRAYEAKIVVTVWKENILNYSVSERGLLYVHVQMERSQLGVCHTEWEPARFESWNRGDWCDVW